MTLEPRQVAIREFVFQGLTNPEIAERLGTSPDAVRRDLTRIYAEYRIFGSHPRIQLVKMLMESARVE